MNISAVVNTRDQRKNIRITPHPKEPISININGDNFIDILHANDISIGGVGITVPHGFEKCNISGMVVFIIELPMDEMKKIIKVQGEIKHLSGTRFGVAFKNITDASQVTIKQYIATKIKQDSYIDWLRYKIGLLS